MIIAKIDWSEYKSFKTKFDFVLGADILNKAESFGILEKLVRKLLNVGGYALFVVPTRSVEIMAKFTEQLDELEFSTSRNKLID